MAQNESDTPGPPVLRREQHGDFEREPLAANVSLVVDAAAQMSCQGGLDVC